MITERSNELRGARETDNVLAKKAKIKGKILSRFKFDKERTKVHERKQGSW